jgi:nucleoid DNA-binding protein
MELIDLVSDLLFKHNCVIIPGLGGFVANYKSAEIPDDRRSVIPARKKIAFNQSLTENDGLLVNALSGSKNVPYELAEKEVMGFVKLVKDRVLQNKSYEFRNIGTFYLNKDNNLIFVPYEGLNMLPASFGLQPVKIRPLLINFQESEPKVDSEIEIKEKKTFSFKRIFPLIGAASVIGFAMLSYLFITRTGEFHFTWHDRHEKGITVPESTLNSQEAAIVAFDSQTKPTPIEEKVVSDSDDKSVVSKEKVDLEKAMVPTETVTEKSDNPRMEEMMAKFEALKSKLTFHIAIKLMKDCDNTTLIKQNYNENGFLPILVKLPDGNCIISIEHFSSKKNAEEYLDIIKRSSFKNAWILETTK